MYDIKACFGCFATDVKLISLDNDQLRCQFQLITGVRKKECIGMPDYLCYLCAALLRSSVKFRERCQRAHYTLKEILIRNQQINSSILNNINRQTLDIMPPLSYVNTKNLKQEEVKYEWKSHNRKGFHQKDNIPISHCTTIPDTLSFNITNTEASINDESLDLGVEEIKEDNLDQSMVVDDQDQSMAFDDSDNQDSTLLKAEEGADGSNLDEEYAVLVPLSMKEAQAAFEVYRMFGVGKNKCKICNKSYHQEKRLLVHLRMHDKHLNGNFECTLCKTYYKTDFLLKTHMTDKHMFKYICRKCPEVSFDRTSAKQHYIWSHLQKGNKKNANWYDVRPSWLSTKGGNHKTNQKLKKVATLRPVRKLNKLPDDFLIYSPISQEEQYELIELRKNSRNFLDAKYQCNLCFRGFQLHHTFHTHMKKHVPTISGAMQCDMCKLYFENHRKLYKHMSCTHLYKYSCQICSFTCFNKGQAQMHYRWHNNVTYECPHCKKQFTKASTRLTHIRIKHPSMCLCNICGHSFVSDSGLYFHKNLKHSKEEIDLSKNLAVDKSSKCYCSACDIQFLNDAAFNTHFGSSYKHATVNRSTTGRKRLEFDAERQIRTPSANEVVNIGLAIPSNCEVCKVELANDRVARRHYESQHPDTDYLKRYMCHVCGHTTRQYANLLVHMRTHTKEKPYACPHCPRRFSMPSNRDRHLVVHTGEKKFQCQHCSRRFTQSSGVKLHIQTVHLKIPYAPWNKKNRKRKKELENGSVSACLPPPAPTQPKLTFDQHGDYINAYITYNDV